MNNPFFNSIITLYQKAYFWYIKYKIVIWIFLYVVSFSFTLYYFYLFIVIKPVVQGVIVAHALEHYAPEQQAEVLKALVYTTELIYNLGVPPKFTITELPTNILRAMSPENAFTDWLKEFYPNCILKDMLGRDYYVITEDISKQYFDVFMFASEEEIAQIKIDMLAELDPFNYGAFNSSLTAAKEVIAQNNLHVNTIQNILVEENLNITFYKSWLITGCVIGLAFGLFCVKQSLEIAN